MKKPHKYPAKNNPRAKARELNSDWEKLLAKHAAPLFSRKPVAPKIVKPVSKLVPPDAPKIVSNPLGMMGIGAKKEVMKYTGTEMIGIGQLHKSNAVPVFKKQDAVDIAQMRRN